MNRHRFNAFMGVRSLLLLLVGAGCAPTPEPTAPSTLHQREARQSTPTGSLNWQGYGFTTTPLLNGKVLVAGGYERRSRAELYDPATGAFTDTATLPDGGRAVHAAVRLTDGQVLVTGNENPETAVNALRYDPRTATWSFTAPMETPRLEHGMVLLPEGRVLVTGGWNYATQIPFSSCERFDPATNTWTPVASMNRARRRHVTVGLPTGKVLVTGGEDSGRSAELYDPATNTWTLTGTPTLTSVDTGLALPTGKVLVVGRVNAQASAELYDPATGTWAATGARAQGRQGPTALLVSKDRVFLFGGMSSGGYATSVERYNLLTNTWSVADSMLSPRTQGGAALLDNGQVLLVGGLASGELAELYSDASACTPVSCATQGKTCGVIHDGCGGLLTCGACGEGRTCTASNVCATQSYQADGQPLYDAQLEVPRCAQLGPRCDSGELLKGRATLRPEANAPNTLTSSRCLDGLNGTYQSDTSLEALSVVATTGSLAASKDARIQARVYASADFATNALDLYIASDARAPTWTFITTLVPSGAGLQTLETTYNLPVGGAYQALRGVFRVGGTANACGQGGFTDTDDLVFAVNLPPPPSAEVTAPSSATRVQGQVLVQANARSATGITRVDFFVGTTLLCSDTSAPYTCDWDTLSFTNATYDLKVVATTPSGASVTSESARVTVANDRLPPTATPLAPTPGQRVRGTSVTIKAQWSDDVALSRTELYVNGVLKGGSTTTGSAYPTFETATSAWNSMLVNDGTYVYFARALDQSGKQTESEHIAFIVDNTPPTTAITEPAEGAEVVGSLRVRAEAADLQGIQSVALLVNGTVSSTKTAAPYTFDWNSVLFSNGAYVLTVRATDATGNLTTSAPVNITVNNPPSTLAAYDMARKAPGCLNAGALCDSGGLLDGRGTVGPELNAPNTLGNSCSDATTGTYHVHESLDRLKVSTLDGSALAPGKTVRIEATVWASGAGSYSYLDLYTAPNANSPAWTFLTTLSAGGGGQRVLSTTYTLPAGTLQAVRGVVRYAGSRATCATGNTRDHDDLFFATP